MIADANTSPAELASWLAEEQAKVRKLEIIFGKWWRHYAVPYEFRCNLYTENPACPYCGGLLGPSSKSDAPGDNEFEQSAHLDHMDPLSKGGEDSIRNAVYVCSKCNLAKRDRLFIDWLEVLPSELREKARALYVAKHGHPPEAFQPAAKQARLTLPRIELQFDEAVLRKLFPKPIVTGPPDRRGASQ